jgi:hypothetical protein
MFFRYYMFAVENEIYGGAVDAPPLPLPQPINSDTVVGEMVQFIDDGTSSLHNEKEDI